VTALFVCSCKKELEPQESSSSTSLPAAGTNAVTPNLTTETAAVPLQNAPVAQQNTTVNTQPAKTLAGMNPPHGQAGHRCDISVGAPLNSPINKNVTTPAVTNSPTISPTTVANSVPVSQTPAILSPNAVTTTVTQPGMNPPHGQEGHRCDIAVGAALPK
jgi:hypothetical protein